MNSDDLIAKVQSFVYVLRRGQTEKVLAILALSLFSAAAYLREEWKQFPWAPVLASGLSAVFALWLFLRIWKRAAPPPPPPDVPMPNAIKGLLPFTAADGRLFARLGRRSELQLLLGLAQDNQVGISVVRGQSGAGKTSLLQAGVLFTLGDERCVYWEAVPTKASEALLHALRSGFPAIESLESLPDSCPSRCVLILDQLEQLRRSDPGHAGVFSLLERIAKEPAPHKLSAIVGFRREFTPDWLDFEQACEFRAEQVPVNLLAPRTANDALVTLASEAGFTVDNALVENFVSGITRPEGISPVDVSIGVLSLANFVQQSGKAHVGMAEYKLAGGAEGLLLAFAQQKLEEIPESIRAPLLKGIVLALMDLSNNQRVAEGATAAVIASKAEVAESAVAPSLERLAHPRIRLLENAGAVRYRLPHERLVPVLRRLAGQTLASLDQLRLVFESEFERWRESRAARHLLSGKELRRVLRSGDHFVQGETAALKTEYLNVCRKRRTTWRLATSAMIVALAAAGYEAVVVWDGAIQQQKLRSWAVPPAIFYVQRRVDALEVTHSINDLTWLRGHRIKELSLNFTGSSLAGIEEFQGLTALSLNLSTSQMQSLVELQRLRGLTTLSLGLQTSQITNLASLEQLSGLTSLTLDVNSFQMSSLKGLTQLIHDRATSATGPANAFTSLKLNMAGSPEKDLSGLRQFNGITSLSVDMGFSQIKTLSGLEQLKGLQSLSLGLNLSQIPDLAGLDRIQGLTSLTLNLFQSPVSSLAELSRISREDNDATSQHQTGLASLTLVLGGSRINDLAELKQISALNSLTLDLRGSQIASLAGLEQIHGLTSLSLLLGNSRITSLAELMPIQGLTTLSLDLRGSQVTSLGNLSSLKRLNSLTIAMGNAPIKDLSELKSLTALGSLTLDLSYSNIITLQDLAQIPTLKSLSVLLSGSKINLKELELFTRLDTLEAAISGSRLSEFSRLNLQRDKVRLWVLMGTNDRQAIPRGCKYVGLTDGSTLMLSP